MKRKRCILWIAVSSTQQAEVEKDSLPEQERRLREIAERFSWQIIDIIVVPGHSRVYYNFPEFASAAAAEGMNDPARMLEHWKRRDFDVFACVAGDRFGRSASIFNEVVERTYDAGAQVYTLRDGLIERGNEGTWAVMASYAASHEVKELKRRHHFGMNKRAERGLPISSKILSSHRATRDPNGKAVGLEVKDELRPLFDAFAELILEGIPWHSLERQAYERYGLVGDNGKPYPPRFFYQLVHAPVFWGHSARNYFNPNAPTGYRRGAWMFDPDEPPPEGVRFYPHTHEAVYTGDRAERVKAELRRRMSLRGSARPNSDYPLSGLFECTECGNKLAFVNSHGTWRAARCNIAYNVKPPRKCSQRKAMPERYALDYLRQLVALAVEADNVASFFNGLDGSTPTPDPTLELERQLEAIEEEGRRLIQKQLHAPASLSALYDEQIQALGERLDLVRARLAACRRQSATPDELAAQARAVTDIRALGDAFWQLAPHEINQHLRRALGRRVFGVRDGKIVRVRRLS